MKKRCGTLGLMCKWIGLLFFCVMLTACEKAPEKDAAVESTLERVEESLSSEDINASRIPPTSEPVQFGQVDFPILPTTQISQELIPIDPGDLWGAITTDGEIVYEPQFKSLEQLGDSAFYLIGKDTEYSILYALGDCDGNLLTDFVFSRVHMFAEESVIFLSLAATGSPDWDFMGNETNTAPLLMDMESGELMMDGRDWAHALPVFEYSYAMLDDTLAVVDERAQLLYLYSLASLRTGEKSPLAVCEDILYCYPEDGDSGFFRGTRAGEDYKEVLIDVHGNILELPPESENTMLDGKNGFVLYADGYWIYTDKDFNQRIPGKYREAMPFSGDFAAVDFQTDEMEAAEWGLVDKSGKRITQMLYQTIP